ncbi:suppressor of fused domain protein [Asanoa sp. NPDC050611]|uniref:suppressor of fused domain protein n=1 Tax=Asanoa sp. NPDC050611 TaxID=3157098 RepID=UPI0033F4D96C
MSHIDLLLAEDSPDDGLTSVATIGLSDRAVTGTVRPPLGCEVVGCAPSDVLTFANAVAAIAFYVINDRWECRPGAVFPGCVGAYVQGTTVPHLLLVPPFLWATDFPSRTYTDKTVAWLLAVPITERERLFVEQRQDSAELEKTFEAVQIDLFDLHRPSVL